MQTVSSDFTTRAGNANRKIIGKLEIDWDLDGVFTDEVGYVKYLELERTVNEPLGGVNLSQIDIVLNNTTDRFSPGSASAIVDYLVVGREAKISCGFVDEYLQIGRGVSEVPQVERKSREAKIHFFDELSRIENYKLSGGGELYLDIRTDRYIWDILDEIYQDYFDVIASCNADESWTGGASEVVNQRGGDAARKVQSTAGAELVDYTEPASPLDLSSYADTDYIDLFVYCEDDTLIDNVEIRLETTSGSAYFSSVLNTSLITGWNELHILRGDFTETGSPNWNSIARISLVVEATGSDNMYCIFDEIRIVSAINYPQRFFDTGLQTITVAYWGGNTALYEIKTACEAEGARFYADELGKLHFENRQFYNNHDEYKSSVWQFLFNRMTDFKHPSNEQDIINKVVVVLKPRLISGEVEIWRYGVVPSIATGVTKTVWASFIDPCPTTAAGIVEPVVTTDYTANTQADGGGTDKTSEIGIVTTKFTDSVKLEITNNDAGTVYLTLLKLRGTPAVESDPIYIKDEDATSIADYGEHPSGGYEITNKYMNNETFAATLAAQLLSWYKDPLERIVLRAKAVPQLQLGDMITVRNDDISKNFLMRITRIKTTIGSNEGLFQEIHCRAVSPFEALTFFEIGASEIGGTDVIAP